MPQNFRVPHAAQRIEDAARWVDVVLMKLDGEADRLHAAHDRTRQIMAGHLLRLQALAIMSGDSRRYEDEIRAFNAAYRDLVHATEVACRAIASRECNREPVIRIHPSPN